MGNGGLGAYFWLDVFWDLIWGLDEDNMVDLELGLGWLVRIAI